MSDHERERQAEKGRLICAKTSHVLLKFLSGIEAPQPVGQVIDKFKEIEEKDPSVLIYRGSISEFEKDLTYLEFLGLITVWKGEEENTVAVTEVGKYFAELFKMPEFLRAEFEEEN